MSGENPEKSYKFFDVLKLDSRGSIVIPKKMRDELGLAEDDALVLFYQELDTKDNLKRIVLVKFDDIADPEKMKAI
jgi:AbrB family looped-hinge helix DNA binding protein